MEPTFLDNCKLDPTPEVGPTPLEDSTLGPPPEVRSTALEDSTLGLTPEVGPSPMGDCSLSPAPEVRPTPLKDLSRPTPEVGPTPTSGAGSERCWERMWVEAIVRRECLKEVSGGFAALPWGPSSGLFLPVAGFHVMDFERSRLRLRLVISNLGGHPGFLAPFAPL